MTSGDFYDSYGLILKLQHSFKQLQTSDNQEYRYKIAIDQKKVTTSCTSRENDINILATKIEEKFA